MNIIIKRIWNQSRMVCLESLSGMAFQAEADSHTFEISGTDGYGEAIPFSGSVSAVFIRPDSVDIPIIGEIIDGAAAVTLTEDCYAVPGRFALTVYLISDGDRVAIYGCTGTVTLASTGVVGGDTPANVADLIDEINTAVATIPPSYADLLASIAPTFSDSVAYPAGAYVWYGGSLYRCTTDHLGGWSAEHWTLAVLSDDVNDVRRAIKYDEVSFVDGAFIRTNVTTPNISSPSINNKYSYAVLPCSPGDVFYVKATMTGAAQRTWVFVNAEGTYVLRSELGAEIDGLITAPATAARLIVDTIMAQDKLIIKQPIYNAVQQNADVVQNGDVPVISAQKFANVQIQSSTGKAVQSANRASMCALAYADNDIIVGVKNGFLYNILYYSHDDVFVRASSGTDTPTIIHKGTYYRTQVWASDGTNMTVNELIKGLWFKPAFSNIGHDLTWDWWFTTVANDSFGNAYIGFIDKSTLMGVAKRNTDGTMEYRYLANAVNSDDHNPFGVCVDGDGYIYAFGTLGHSYANTILIKKSKEPYTVDCDWDDLSINLSEPDGYTYKCTYGQAYVYDDGTTKYITDFFRVVSTNAGTCYGAIQSTDGGSTWTLYGVTAYSDPYIKFFDKGGGVLGMVCTCNPINSNRNLYLGEIDITTGVISSNGLPVGSWTEIENGTGTGATAEISGSCSVNASTDFSVLLTSINRLRLLDAVYDDGIVKVLWAEADDTLLDWTYYLLRANGDNVALGKSGIPFYKYSGYLPGACFVAGSFIAVCRNIVDEQDDKHTMYVYSIEGENPVQKGVFNGLACRPIDCGNAIVAVSIGKYNDTSTPSAPGSFTNWELSPMFLTVL